MTAIIPAAGLGTRFLPLTRVVPKEMLPIGAHPALELIVDEARQAGATKIIIIISHAKELVREYFKDAKDITFVYQEEQHGLGHAVLQARGECAADESLLILLGDALVIGCCAAKEMADLARASGAAAVIGCEHVPPEKVSRYGILKVEEEGQGLRSRSTVVDLIEKPALEEAPSDLAIAGRYLLPGVIFDYLATQTPGKGGEIQLTDAIRRMIADGKAKCLAYPYPGKRQDIGNPDGYFQALEAYHDHR